MKRLSFLVPAILIFLDIMLGGCGGKASTRAAGEGSGKKPLVIFAAGSLIIPFSDLEKAFESGHPDIDIQAQYHGSIQVMRHVTDLHELVDVVATADASLIPMLMYAADDPVTGQPYANWYIKFASNHLELAYQPNSKYADEINAENWYTLLERPDVKVGLADPRFDPSGYRALMAFALAQGYYHQPTIFTGMFENQFSFPLGIFSDDGLTTVTVPEIVETKTDAHGVIRGACIALRALLGSVDLDYAFDYESVIRQHHLGMVKLPEALDLGTPGFEDVYNTVQVNLDFKRFATVKPQFRGERIGYGITIPGNAPHPSEAGLFVAFLLGPEGRAIMQADYHPVFEATICDGCENMPPVLQALCVPEVTLTP